jgi:hypothetical protein
VMKSCIGGVQWVQLQSSNERDMETYQAFTSEGWVSHGNICICFD